MVAWRQGPVEFPGGSPIQLAKVLSGSGFPYCLNRDMLSMSKQVKAIRARLAKNRSMNEKVEHILTPLPHTMLKFSVARSRSLL